MLNRYPIVRLAFVHRPHHVELLFQYHVPTIFSLGLKNLGKHTKIASSYIVTGVVGGAIFPPIMGQVQFMTRQPLITFPSFVMPSFLFGYRLYRPTKN